jgi:hypothetical protein
MQEIYKDVVGFEDYFQVSNLGNVYSKRTSKVLKQTVSKTGYYSVATKIGGRKGQAYCFKVHRLVAEAFLPEPDKYIKESIKDTVYGVIVVNHKDGNKLNNLVENFEWCTYKENTQHAILMGLVRSPESYIKFPCGTAAAYKRGCRCNGCTSAYRIVRRQQYLRTNK